MKTADRRIDYVEFPTTDVAASRAFYAAVFGWTFTDYGPDYTSFEDGRISGGFFRAPPHAHAARGPLVVIYSAGLRETKAALLAAGATISRDTFSFPGGFRFQFIDPGGNELAVWSEQDM